MSRTLKRVPMGFDWPLDKIWGGFINPYYKQAVECPDCENGYDRKGGRVDANAALFYEQWYGHAFFDPITYGADPIKPDDPAILEQARRNVESAPNFYMTSEQRDVKSTFLQQAMLGFPNDDRPMIPQPRLTRDRDSAVAREARRLYEVCYRSHWCHHLIQADVDALIDADRLWTFTRVPRDAGQALVVAIRMAFHNTNSWLPTPNGHRPMAAEVNAWSRGRGLGHDGINQGVCIEARCKREGVPYTCARCAGSGRVWPTPEIQQRYKTWKPVEPPTGDGYQLWEICSDGSPQSPVFSSIEELCTWAADHATTFASFKATAEEWRNMLDDDCVYHQEGNKVFM